MFEKCWKPYGVVEKNRQWQEGGLSVNLYNCQIFYSTRYCGQWEISTKKKTKYSIDINAKMGYTVEAGQLWPADETG